MNPKEKEHEFVMEVTDKTKADVKVRNIVKVYRILICIIT